ncbi:DUF58 domain-containing protein [Actinophytocola xanthii]|uniref:DUF58 domain-containing protein n=1 Tax=Actinophytocola xanthii TaxID=1912961 RepID=A0A1Q8C7N8_9PSEU|nr:DUF58 domain-containing protein [Actinophytocola xanthii]OLF10372.1 hypothetical protein BU204_31710 [Actinophytocola xanthii]
MITRAGAVLGGAGAVLLGAGMWADYPELVMLGLACAAALTAAAGWMLVRPRLAVAREISPSRVPEGTPAYGVLSVTNTGRRRSPPSLAVETVAGRRVVVPLPSLPAGDTFDTTYALPAQRRGRHLLPPLAVGHADPLRLCQVVRTGGAEAVLYVHPTVHQVAPMPLGGPRDLEGPTSASSPQGGVAFHSLRDYQPGDDWRRIHWASTARTGTLLVRYNVVPDEPHHLVVLDTSEKPYDDAFEDAFEDAVRVAASVCDASARAGFSVTCRTTGHPAEADGHVPPAASAVTSALDVLSAARPSPGDPGLSALGGLVTELAAGEGSALTVVTGQGESRGPELLATLPPSFSAAALVRIGRTLPVSSTVAAGVFTIDARTSREFAVRWNQLFAR